MSADRISFVLAPTEPRADIDSPREEDWLPVLGPTAWLLGHLLLDETSAGRRSEWDLLALAARLGVGGSCATVRRAIGRLERFRIVRAHEPGEYLIRRTWGRVPRWRAKVDH